MGNLYFAAFKSPEFNDVEPDCLFSPCPNCTVFLNRYSAGYFIERTEFDQTVGRARSNEKKDRVPPERRNSNIWIINPQRPFKDFQFQLKGKLYALRCFCCSG
jgi:hypothetical protein